MSEPVKFGSGLIGNKMLVYDNRVVIVSGCVPFRRRRSIPMRSISSVTVPHLLNQVVIQTNDGKRATFSIGNARRMAEAIQERM